MIKIYLTIVVSLCLFNCALASETDDKPVEKFSLRGDASTGSNIRKVIAGPTNIPLDKKYSEFTPKQKEVLASMYEKMGEKDEPPFPINGLRDITKALWEANQVLQVEGDLFVIADVDADGKVNSITVSKSPSKEITDFISQVLFLTKFKPALCAGTPCAQQYPFDFLLEF